jgi:hypothetical protein
MRGNDIVVPSAALQDFDGDKDIFGFYYDVGRVMLHSSVVVREEMLGFHGTNKPDFLAGYKRIICGRKRSRPRLPDLAVVLTVDIYYVARFALEACMEYPWLPKRADIVSRGAGPPTAASRPIPRLLRPMPDWEAQNPASQEPPSTT